MYKHFLILVLCAFSFSQAQGLNNFFNKADVFLKANVKNDKVDYQAIKNSPAALNELTNIIGSANLAKENSQTTKAFYINAYNITMISAIVAKYPIKSPLDISGVFDKSKYTFAGNKLTLNDVENKMIRAKYNDPRVHFALVCGANGCPPITNFAYTPSQLDKQLDKQTKLAINDPGFIQINTKTKKVAVSQIFEWYNADFVSKKTNLVDFLNKYLNNSIDRKYKVSYYKYDWTLNKK